MASSSGMTATPFVGPAPANPVDTGGAAVGAEAAPPPTPAPPSAPRAFDVKSLATSVCKAIARQPAWAALLFAGLMYLGMRYRRFLPPTHGRMVVASAFGALLYLLAVVSSGDLGIASRGLSGLMGTADGTAGMSVAARVKASWFVVYPAIAIAAASVPSLRPWPLVAVVGTIIVLPGVLAAKT